MSKVDSAVSTAPEAALDTARPRRKPFLVEFYESAIAKKWIMAITGIMLLGFVLFHMVGNLKIYLGQEDIDHYAEWLRDIGHPALPRTVFLWILRGGLITAFALHIHAAYSLTRMNHRARPVKYQSPRDYAAANFASRTMRWTGVIVGLYVIFHLLDLTFGTVNPDFVRGSVYHNMVESLQRWPVAIAYIVANIALGIHIFHGAWAMFQSLGLTNPRFNAWRRYFATGFAVIVTLGNISFPILILAGVVG